MLPPRLKKGDEIRIIAPSLFFNKDNEKTKLARVRIELMGYKVSYSHNFKKQKEANIFGSSSIAERVEDIHNAFSSSKVKAIIALAGGYNANQLLPYLDYKLIKKNPKFFGGYSDITILNNAIFAKTGLVTYSCPNFNNFSVANNLVDYTIKYFNKCVSKNKKYKIKPSNYWIDNSNAYGTVENVFFNKGLRIINSGNAEGISIGGNLCTFNLLQGTEYMPSLKDSILFIEDDQIFTSTKTFWLEFERNLQSLIHQPNFNKVKGIVFGRFEQRSEITIKMLSQLIKTKKELKKIPILANANFGHTSPIFTFPIGGKVNINAFEKNISISILAH